MSEQPSQIAIVSGYFNPLHVGHLDMMEAARSLTGYLVVIVNNDAQQVIKKGKVIQSLEDRLRIVRALRVTDDAIAAVDEDATVSRTLGLVRERYPSATLIFANGGDRSQRAVVAEADVCEALGIDLRFGVGGETKADSSSRINAIRGLEPTTRVTGWRGEVRPAETGDADEVASLAAALALSFAFSAARFRENFPSLLADEGACLLLAVDGDESVGYLLGFRHLTFYANGPVGWVEEIVVRDEQRGQGIGRILMSAFEQWATARECALIALATRRAAPFYRALGYEESATYFRKVLIN